MAMNHAKALSLILAVVVMANFLGLVFKVVKPQTFWLVTVIAAITAYWVIPKLGRKK